ncbi:putative leader peptide [Kitasatospora sp. NPDC085879]
MSCRLPLLTRRRHLDLRRTAGGTCPGR